MFFLIDVFLPEEELSVKAICVFNFLGRCHHTEAVYIKWPIYFVGRCLNSQFVYFGSVDGLVKNGAIEPAARPLWFDIYKAFPPKIEPSFERPLPTNLQVREILYAEDRGRA